jgi:hypothetical protein
MPLFGQALNDTTGRSPKSPQANTPKPGPAPGPILKPKDSDLPVVTKISTVYDDDSQALDAKKEGKPIVAYPGNIIRFKIRNARAFLNSRPNDNAKVVLYVNGVEMKGIYSEWFSTITRQEIIRDQMAIADTATVNIPLRRNETTNDSWHFFYNNTNKFTDNYVNLNASIGWQGMSELQRLPGLKQLSIVYYRVWVFWLWLGLYMLILGLFIYIALRTDALKDSPQGAYSLSLAQLFFWTTLVIGAFIYTLVLTDVLSSFNTSILLLLGISASTTGVAYAVDSNFNYNNPGLPEKITQGSFFKDILTDGTTYSVQRIQIVAWNLVLGLYFIIYTIDNKSMPEFTSTMLFLAGISSASYLSAKGAENTNVKTEVERSGGTAEAGADSASTPAITTPAVG